jgi:antitoxin component YwqK of YwqJK toxin-antitoxin module
MKAIKLKKKIETFLFLFSLCFLIISCEDAIISQPKQTVIIKDTIDISKIIEYKYNPLVYDSLMKPLSGILKSKHGINGEFVEGKREGTHKSYYAHGVVSWEALYKNGLPDGEWKCYDESGKLVYETAFHKGSGYDITINYNGDTLYIAKYESGKLNGELKRYYNDGSLMYSTVFIKGTGIDKRYHQNKNLAFEQPLIDGKENGTYKEFYENGKIRRVINFKNGLPNGNAIYWDENGIEVSNTIFKDGIELNK